VSSLPKTITRQCRDCDLNPGPSARESSTLTTRLPSHPYKKYRFKMSASRTAVAPPTDAAVDRTATCPGEWEWTVTAPSLPTSVDMRLTRDRPGDTQHRQCTGAPAAAAELSRQVATSAAQCATISTPPTRRVICQCTRCLGSVVRQRFAR